MTRFRLVSLCLVAILCLSVATPADAMGPEIVPSGIAATISDAFDRLLDWFRTLGRPTGMGPEIVPSG